jgi:hypothetical protein
MKLRIKEKLGNLKGKIKIRQRFVNLKERVKQRPLKYGIPIVFVLLLVSPLRSYAEDRTCLNLRGYPEDRRCLDYENQKFRKDYENQKTSKLLRFHELTISVVALRKCFDPCVRPLEKAYYFLRPFCLVAGFTAGYVLETTTPGSQIHRIAAVCCVSFWKAHYVLSNKFF